MKRLGSPRIISWAVLLACLLLPLSLLASRHTNDLPSSRNGSCTSLAQSNCQNGNGSFPFVAAYPSATPALIGTNFTVTVTAYLYGTASVATDSNSGVSSYSGATANSTVVDVSLSSSNSNARLVAIAVGANLTNPGYVTAPEVGFQNGLPYTHDSGTSLSLSDPVVNVESGYTLWALGPSPPNEVVLVADGVPMTTTGTKIIDPTDGTSLVPTTSAANGIAAPSSSATFAIVVFNGSGYEIVGGLPLVGEPFPCGFPNGTPSITCHDFSTPVEVDLSTGSFSEWTRADNAPSPTPTYTTDVIDPDTGNDTAVCGSTFLSISDLNLRAAYSYTPSSNQTVNISTAGSHYQTVVDVTDGTTVTCSDMSADGTAFQAGLDNVPLKGGTQYLIYIGDYPPIQPSQQSDDSPDSDICDTQDANGNISPCPLTSDPVLNFSITVQPEVTATSLSCAPTNSVTGTPVACTATVSDTTTAANIPTGSVQFGFTAGSSATAAETLTAQLSNGVATATISSLTAASYTVTATLQPSTSQFLTSSGATTLTITNPSPITTTTTASASQSSVLAGAGFMISAILSKASGTTPPTGTLSLFDSLAQVGPSASVSTNPVSFAINSATVGTHSYTVQYSGDSFYTPSTSTAVQVVVNQDASTTTLTSSSSSVDQNGSITLTAAVANASGTSLAPTGTVTFFSGSSSIGTGVLNNGVATLTTSALSASAMSYSLTAQYGGDANFTSSTSTAITVTVVAATFKLSAAPSSISASPNTPGTTTISLAPTGGFTQVVTFACSGLPTGASCSFSPATLTPDPAGDTASTVLTVSTSAISANNSGSGSKEYLAICLAGCIPFLFFRHRKRGFRRHSSVVKIWLATLVLLCTSILAVGCGSGNSMTSQPQTTTTNSIVTVTGTSGSGAAAMSQSLQITVAITN